MLRNRRTWAWYAPAGTLLAAIVLLAGSTGAPARAEERPAAELLPPTTLVYLEIPRPREVISGILDHPLRARIEALDAYQQAVRRKEYLAFQGILGYVELKLGMSVRQALEELTSGGIVLAFDPATNGVALIVTSEDEPTLKHLRDTLQTLGREDAKNKGRKDPYREREYRGVQVENVKGVAFATIGRQLLVVNQDALGQAIVDRMLDGGAESLAATPTFQAGRQSRREQGCAWLWMDVARVRAAEAEKGKPFHKQTDNPVAELLLGGLLDNLQHAEWLTLDLLATPKSLSLAIALPHDAAWVTESREYYFGPQGQGTAPALPTLDGQILGLSTYRNLSGMWQRAGDLFPENVVDKLAEADSNLTTLFAGRDFGEDILGALGPDLSIVVVRQSFSPDRPQPSIRLPAFALVCDLKNPDVARPELRRVFQSLVGFVNITGAQNGQPQLELDLLAAEGFELVTARFVPRVGREQDAQAPLQFNFSPSVAFAGRRFVLASTEGLARAVAQCSPPAAGDAEVNTAARLDIAALRETLEDNHTHLVSQNMLKEGHSHDEAELQVGTLLTLLQTLEDVGLQLRTHPGRIELELSLRLREGQ